MSYQIERIMTFSDLIKVHCNDLIVVDFMDLFFRKLILLVLKSCLLLENKLHSKPYKEIHTSKVVDYP
jgi:hypothetical protein